MEYCFLTSSCFCVPGFHRNEDMKAIDVLPILKEKVAFLSGPTHEMISHVTYEYECGSRT